MYPEKVDATSGGGADWKAGLSPKLKERTPEGAVRFEQTDEGATIFYDASGKVVGNEKGYNANGSVFTSSTAGTGTGSTGTRTTATGDLSTLLSGNGSAVGGDLTSSWTNGSFKIDENMFNAASNGMFAGILSTMFGGTNMVNWMQNVYNGFLNSLSFNFNTSSTSTSTRTDTDNEGATVDGGSKTSSNTSGQKSVSDFPSGGKITKPEGAEKYEIKDGITIFYDNSGKVIARYGSDGTKLQTDPTETPTGNNPTGSKPTGTNPTGTEPKSPTAPAKKKTSTKPTSKKSNDPRPVKYTYDEFIENNSSKFDLKISSTSGGGHKVVAGSKTYSFDSKGRMTGVSGDGKNITYGYSGDDKHIVSTTETNSSTYSTTTKTGDATVAGFNKSMKDYNAELDKKGIKYTIKDKTVTYTKPEKGSTTITITKPNAGTLKYTYNDLNVTVKVKFASDGKSIESISETQDTKYAHKRAKEAADKAETKAKNQKGNNEYFDRQANSGAPIGCVPGNK